MDKRTRAVGCAILVSTWVLTGCGTDQTGFSASSRDGAGPAGTDIAPPCPTDPVAVVVSVDQWGDIASQLGGACTTVNTVLASSSIDPHDYEPSPADAASFIGAKLVVVNGADYDHWATDLAATSASSVPVINAAEVTRTPEGANPHLWYSPSAVTLVADAVTSQLSKIDPSAATYFGARRAAFGAELQSYTSLIDNIRTGSAGKSYAATEGVFDYLAEALGLVNRTPQGYRRAATNESDPSPADIGAFRTALASRLIDVLIYNTQTEGSIPEQIRQAAEQAGVPVVEVTETVPPGQSSFVSWQDQQLQALGEALGVAL
jgi:zinc/manganese transport system substrate-binding protein